MSTAPKRRSDRQPAATKPGEKKPDENWDTGRLDLEKDCIAATMELIKNVKFRVKDKYFFVERNKELHLVYDMNLIENEILILGIDGRKAKAGYSAEQYAEAGRIIHKHFKED